jgi:hypothetical protein
MTAEQNPFLFFPIYHHHLAASVPSSTYTTSHQCVSLAPCSFQCVLMELLQLNMLENQLVSPSYSYRWCFDVVFAIRYYSHWPPNPMASTLYIIIILCPQLPLLFFLRCERQKNNTKKSEKEEKVVLRCVGSRLLI